jgi:hypothetical protein
MAWYGIVFCVKSDLLRSFWDQSETLVHFRISPCVELDRLRSFGINQGHFKGFKLLQYYQAPGK